MIRRKRKHRWKNNQNNYCYVIERFLPLTPAITSPYQLSCGIESIGIIASVLRKIFPSRIQVITYFLRTIRSRWYCFALLLRT